METGDMYFVRKYIDSPYSVCITPSLCQNYMEHAQNHCFASRMSVGNVRRNRDPLHSKCETLMRIYTCRYDCPLRFQYWLDMHIIV